MKTIFIVCDGLGDRPIKQFGGKTPLEAAKTTNMNKLSEKGITGIVDVVGTGIKPGSDTAHLSLFGYPIEKYYTGRGVFEAAGIGMDIKKGDIALRCNIGTIENGVIKDRRAGRLKEKKELIKELQGIKINGIEFILKDSTEHRAGLVMRGKGLSSDITDGDPHREGVFPLKIKARNNSRKAKFTAKVLNKFINKSNEIMEKSSFNKKRKLPANYLLVRGAANLHPHIPDFYNKYGMKAACVAGAGLYKGVAKIVGMDIIDVKGATGAEDTDLDAKISKAIELTEKYDFVFVHIKATDNFSHDGNYKGKKAFIEKIDKSLKPITNLKNVLVIATGDHSTPCTLKDHSGDPVPIIMKGEGVRTDSNKKFGERCCSKGGILRINGIDIMNEILNITGNAKLCGD